MPKRRPRQAAWARARHITNLTSCIHCVQSGSVPMKRFRAYPGVPEVRVVLYGRLPRFCGREDADHSHVWVGLESYTGQARTLLVKTGQRRQQTGTIRKRGVILRITPLIVFVCDTCNNIWSGGGHWRALLTSTCPTGAVTCLDWASQQCSDAGHVFGGGGGWHLAPLMAMIAAGALARLSVSVVSCDFGSLRNCEVFCWPMRRSRQPSSVQVSHAQHVQPMAP